VIAEWSWPWPRKDQTKAKPREDKVVAVLLAVEIGVVVMIDHYKIDETNGAETSNLSVFLLKVNTSKLASPPSKHGCAFLSKRQFIIDLNLLRNKLKMTQVASR